MQGELSNDLYLELDIRYDQLIFPAWRTYGAVPDRLGQPQQGAFEFDQDGLFGHVVRTLRAQLFVGY
eukprot:9540621-Prorocentrum_lima.AAC.1